MIDFLKKYSLELVFTILFLCLSTVLNMQFTDGSNINTIIAGHDEYIAIKEVYSILQPASLKHLFMAIISGNALYYGRIMFYTDALVAYLPFVIWGVKGMVIAIRMFHAFLMLAALLVLSRHFIEKPLYKVIFFISSVCLYYSMYFIMMPKPEPHQMLILALFMRSFKKNDWSFGPWFVYIGIAYGLKFNVLLLLPIMFLIPVLKNGTLDIRSNVLPGLKSFAFFIIGLVIAIPCLLLSPIKPIFLKTYLHETFGNTEKMYDNAGLGIYQWMDSGLGGSYLGIGFLAFPFMLFVLWLLFRSFKESKITKDYSAFLFLTFGIILTLVIMLKTKRLWPHYLWTGYVFMILGMVNYVDQSKQNKLKMIHTSIITLFTVFSLFFFVERELPLFTGFENQSDVIRNRTLSIKAIEYIKSEYKGSRVGTDASVLYPFEDFVGVDIFHPFTGEMNDRAETRFYWYNDFPEKIWEDSNDIVVFYNRHPERLVKEHPNVYVGRHEQLYELYKQKTSTDFVRDTAFEDLIIYRKK